MMPTRAGSSFRSAGVKSISSCYPAGLDEPIRREVRCGACGLPSAQFFSPAAPPESDEAPDLDTRPNGPVRATITFWMQRCTHCGYCASDVSAIHEQAVDLIATPTYQRRLLDQNVPAKAREFLCHAMILTAVGQPADAGWTCLHAAWICDDDRNEPAAIEARGLAIDSWRLAKLAGQSFGDDDSMESALVVDLQRRMGRFDDALITCTQAFGGDDDQVHPFIEQVLRFEKTLIQKRDTGSYRLNDLPAFLLRSL